MDKEFRKFRDKDLQQFVEGLEETILRLHTWFRELEEKYRQFRWAKKFCRNQGIKIKLGEDKRKEMKDFLEYRYYVGKFYAYFYVLEQLGSDVPKVLERLRGIVKAGHNEIMETKMHYTEVKGHFETDEYKTRKNKVKGFGARGAG